MSNTRVRQLLVFLPVYGLLGWLLFYPTPTPAIVLQVFGATLFVLILIEELRIARLTDKLNSLENKPKGKMRFW